MPRKRADLHQIIDDLVADPELKLIAQDVGQELVRLFLVSAFDAFLLEKAEGQKYKIVPVTEVKGAVSAREALDYRAARQSSRPPASNGSWDAVPAREFKICWSCDTDLQCGMSEICRYKLQSGKT